MPVFVTFFPAEMMDSSTFKRFSLSIDSILENLEDVEFNGKARAIYLFFVEFTTLYHICSIKSNTCLLLILGCCFQK